MNEKNKMKFELWSFLIVISSLWIANGDQFKVKSIQLDGILAAFGDFDSDKYSDIFVINSTRQSFEIHKANDIDYYSFFNQPNLTCSCSKYEEIVGLIPSDFHGMAMMDIIVITKFKDASSYSSKWHSDLFNIYLVKGTRHSIDCKNLEDKKILLQSRIQPLLLDFNGDMIGDLLIQTGNLSRYILMFDNGDYKAFELKGNESLRSPNGNAFIDLDNDFLPDIFLEGENVYEYIFLKQLNRGEGSRETQLVRRVFKPDDAIIGSSTFVDYNSDGVIDHLVPTCEDYGCAKSSILVWNQDKVLFTKIASNFIDPENKKKKLCFVKDFQDQLLTVPMKLRHTDVDGDGYMDLIALMTDCTNPEQKEKSVFILKNVPDPQNSADRTFKAFLKIEPKYKDENINAEIILAAFLDLAEDGNPDFVILSKQGDKFIINTLVNENMVDACFFKVLVISGRCYEDCGKSIDNKIKNPFSNTNALGYGTNQAGAVIYFSLVDSEGKQRKSCAGQLSQTADFALQMPYNIFGLGQLPNFVDLLTASLPINYTFDGSNNDDKSNNPRIQSWHNQIVPDSQVVIIPHPANDPNSWKVKLFITPSDYVLSTFLTLIVICLLLLLVIFFLWRREVLEDRLEQKKYKQYWPESK